MKKYITTLVVGVGLMANSPVFAVGYKFDKSVDEPMEECVRSAKEDTEISHRQDVGAASETLKFDRKLYLRKVSDDLHDWKVYVLSTTYSVNFEELYIVCGSWNFKKK